MNNENRKARFTSSKVHLLCANGRSKVNDDSENKWSAGAVTYINEKANEKRFGKCLDVGGVPSQPARWGTFLEMVIYSKLGLEWSIVSKETRKHPKYSDFWSGSPDLIVEGKKIGEIKCYQPKNFCNYNNMLMKQDVQLFKKDFAQEYWQIVSNACIYDVPFGEAISYMPYEEELEEIIQLAVDQDDASQWQYRFIAEGSKETLPHIKKGGYYSSITTFGFDIPKEDKEFLEERIVKASEELKSLLQ